MSVAPWGRFMFEVIVRAMKAYSAAAPLLIVSATSFAQDINFDDLRRPGPGLRAAATVAGVAKEGHDFVARFNEVDRGRLEERRAAIAAAASPPNAGPAVGGANSEGNRRPSAAVAPATQVSVNLASRFICSFRCTDNRFIVINEGKAGPLTLALMAPDQGKARDIVSAEAKNVCWDQFKLSPKSDWFPCRAQ
jgi:hypothetical protein